MNKKLIAVAVASTFAVPVIAQADANWYGRINTAVSFLDVDGGDNSTDIKNISSRFGVKGSEDLGNGLSAVYRYEFGVASDVADVQDNNRLSYVGLSGSFGTVTLGRVWSAFFNNVGTIMDPSQNVGGDGYNGPYRTSNTLSYAGGAGPVSVQVDLNLDGDNANSSGVDAWQAGGTFSTGALSIAAAYQNIDGGAADDTDQFGVAVKYTMESFWVGAGFTSLDNGSDDNTDGAALLAGGGSGDFSWWASLESVSDDDAADFRDASIINLNLTRHLSKNAMVYIEAAVNDEGDAGGDTNEILFGVRADF